MSKKVIVENDKVEGTDKHNIQGQGKTVPPPASVPYPYVGVASFDYVGKMTDQLSDFVKINGKPVAVKTSQSSLNPGESASPTGKHSGPQAKNPTPLLSTPGYVVLPTDLSIPDTVGTGKPSATAGSHFVKIDSTEVLLDSDKIDTCDGLSIPMNSTVTSENQDFVTCSE